MYEYLREVAVGCFTMPVGTTHTFRIVWTYVYTMLNLPCCILWPMLLWEQYGYCNTGKFPYSFIFANSSVMKQ